MSAELTIGRLASEAGISVETIRYYQRRGLLELPPKQLRGQRRYSPAFVARVRFIRRAQALGFTLEEIANLLVLSQAHACAETRDLARQKLMLIEGKLRDLSTMRDVLGQLVSQCDIGAAPAECPIIRSLVDDEP